MTCWLLCDSSDCGVVLLWLPRLDLKCDPPGVIDVCIRVCVSSVPGSCAASIWSAAPWPSGSPACTQCAPLLWSAEIRPRPHRASQTDRRSALCPSAVSGESVSQRGYRRGEQSPDMEGRKKELQRTRDQGCISIASNRGGVVFAVKHNRESPVHVGKTVI